MSRIHRTFPFYSLVILLHIVVLLSGCASHRRDVSPAPDEGLQQSFANSTEEDEFALEDEFAAVETEPPVDPLSGYNRVMTQVNDRVYFWLLKPVSQGYRAVVPEGPRLAVGRFFRNLLMPVSFVNNLLQFKAKRAGTELARFTINTTVGVLGFSDPAADKFDLQPYPEDFGQTLGHYGVGSGFHIVLPLLGPSNLRDTIGLIPDYYLDPVNYIDKFETRIAIKAYKQVNRTSLHIGEYESLKKDAVDLYTFLRDGYEQRRVKQIEE
jgi:phospholipid-binding lipoprotein MlaA